VLPATVKFDLSIKNPKIKSKIWLLVKHSSIAVVSAGIIEHIDILFLKNNLTSYETGLYGGASRFALLFALVAYSLASVLNPRVALYKNYRHLSPYLKKSWMVVLLSLVGFLLFIPFARPLIELTIGSEYLPGLKILLMLAGASFIGIASVPFVALFYSFNADWYFSVSGMLQLVIVLVGNAFFVPVFGLEAAAWTRLIARLFLFLFSMLLGQYFYLKKYRAKSS
jgi:O-antigen/teichoic acid export membrane protein